MARVAINIASAAASSLPRHPRTEIVSEVGSKVVLPLAPQLTQDGLGAQYATFERVGTLPLTKRTGLQLRVLTCTVLLAGRNSKGALDNQVSVEAPLKELRRMGRRGERVQWRNFGPSETGWFRISDLSVTDIQRQQGTNHITVANVSMTFTQAADAVTSTGPLTGGATSVPGKPTAATTPVTSGTRTHKVVSGDTLWKIAVQYYGNGALYPRIADASGVTDPNRLTVGQTLKIPPK